MIYKAWSTIKQTGGHPWVHRTYDPGTGSCCPLLER